MKTRKFLGVETSETYEMQYARVTDLLQSRSHHFWQALEEAYCEGRALHHLSAHSESYVRDSSITAVYLLENRRKVAEAGLNYSLDIKFLHALALC